MTSETELDFSKKRRVSGPELVIFRRDCDFPLYQLDNGVQRYPSKKEDILASFRRFKRNVYEDFLHATWQFFAEAASVFSAAIEISITLVFCFLHLAPSAVFRILMSSNSGQNFSL